MRIRIRLVKPPRRRIKPKQLSPWAERAKAHWKEYRPKMYAELEKAGTLDEEAQKASDQTEEEYCQAIEDGMSPDGAWEMLRERYLFPPSEEDVPLLGENPEG